MKATIEIPDGYKLVKVSDTEYNVVKKIPDTWEEFCKDHPLTGEEAWVDGVSCICEVKDRGIHGRRKIVDRNLLPSKEKAEAILTLCQLIQLRDCYNDGWVPDWTNSQELKYVLILINNKWVVELRTTLACMFAFKSEELRNQFLENFSDLLDKIKPLYQ